MRLYGIILFIIFALFPISKGEEGSPVGIYDNNADGFYQVVLVLGRNGTGFLSGFAGAGLPIGKWTYTKEDSEVSFEISLDKAKAPQTKILKFDPLEKMLTPMGEWDIGVLRKREEEETERYLSRWDRIPNKEALKLAENLSKSPPLKSAGVTVTTMNIKLEEIQEFLRTLEFAIEDTDEVFSIFNVQENLIATVHVRLVGGSWKVIKKHMTN